MSKVLRVDIREIFYRTSILKWIIPSIQVLGSQVLLQGIGLLISLLLIRQMPKADYAFYTLIISIQSILIILSDSGISIGFKFIGGKIWSDDNKLAILLKTALALRWRIVLLAFTITGIYGTFVLLKHNSEPKEIIIFLVSLLMIVSGEIQKSFIQQALLLKQEIMTVQLADLINQCIRLILIALIYYLSSEYLNVRTVIYISVLSVWMSVVFIRRKSRVIRSEKVNIDNEYKNILLRYIKLNWHNSAFFAFQGQISILFISLFGTVKSIAELGALTRYTLVFISFAALVSNIFSPAFGRCQNKTKLVKSYSLILVLLFCFASFIIFLAYLFPHLFLWVLGKQYQHLSIELVLVLISGFVNLIASTIISLNSSKGWIKFTTMWEIPVSIASLIVSALIFDLNSLSGILYLSISGGVMIILLNTANSLAGFKQLT